MYVKGSHPKMTILSLITYPHVIPKTNEAFTGLTLEPQPYSVTQ